MEQTSKQRPVSWKLLAIAAVGVIAFVAFAPSLFGDYIYDDKTLIAHNPYAHSFAYWKRWITHDFWDTGEESRRFGQRLIYWRPAISLSYALDWKIGGGDPAFFHLTNVVWHAAASLLSFFVLRRWLGALVPALFVAALFAVHPTKAESVAWIAGRTDVFCMVAVLLASTGMARRMRGEKGGYPLEIGATLFAYFCKEQAIVLPAFAAVEAWVLAERPAVDLASIKKMVRAGLPQLVVAVVYLFIRSRVLPVRRNLLVGFRPSEYLGQVAETFGRYLELAIFPHDLSVQRALVQTQGGRVILSTGYIVAGICGVFLLVALAFAARKKAPAVTVGIAFFFVTILPTSNIAPMGMLTMISERFLYLPLLGLALAAGEGLRLLAISQRRAQVGYAAATAACILLAIVSARRSHDYEDEHRFWAREMSVHPDSLEAWNFVVSDAVEEHRYNDALRAMMRGQRLAATRYAHIGSEADFIVQAADAMSLLTPDLDEEDLRRLDRFYGELLVDEPGFATLEVGPVRIQLSRRSPAIAPRLKALRPLAFTARALIASRRADDATAISFAEQAQNECAECVKQIAALTVVYARTGDFGRAHQMLDRLVVVAGDDTVKQQRATLAKAELFAKQAQTAPEGPIQLFLRAQELSNLDAYGRAYAVLKEHKEQIKKAPGFAIGFAELAFRAGDTVVAKEVLASIMPEEKIDPTLKSWAKKMGWL